ncbi:hypothetical protein AgCh_005340 [Apium graveolens]
MLMSLKTLDWDQRTLTELGIPAGILLKIVSNSEIIGKVTKGWPITGNPIAGCLGDQHAAIVDDLFTHGLLSTVALKLGANGLTNYAPEGSISIAGAAVHWLRDGLDLIGSATFNGLFSPWWRVDARGVCIGITRFTNKAHITRVVMERMYFQVKDVLDSMHKDATKVESKKKFLLRVDGGATVNNLLMQIQELEDRPRVQGYQSNPFFFLLAENETCAKQNAYKKQIDYATDVSCLMLAISVELPKQQEHIDEYDVIKNLQRMFEG